MAKVFVVEDDEQLRQGLTELLERGGHVVVGCDGRGNVVAAALAAAPDLVLLDLTLPETDGQMLCRQLRAASSVPLAVVTSRDNDIDELLAMSSGADDFITKPFNPQILLARLDALLRRASGGQDGQEIARGGVALDMARGAVSYQGASQTLTHNEMHLLYLLLCNAGSIVSRADLQAELWQTDEFVDGNTLTVNINRLRSTLAAIGVPDTFLQTRRGMGYLVQP